MLASPRNARPCGPMTSIGPYSMGAEDFRPRRGQYGEEPKSVKKNAALLHFLAFGAPDHNFGVLRGEQPLRRGCGVAQRSKPQWGFEPHERASSAGWRPSFWPPSALPRNSGTFFATFFGHKKGRPNGRMLLYRGVRRKVAEHRKELLSGFLLAFGQQRKQPTRHRCPHGRTILGNGA